ncbi:unnamed protein product [Caenorhabditis auriculariae]|uniref:JmjC domain-containing protein n=1 Tax=Caenorhabditis auriculariae TaxID=2777116 RepID=A0A8S1HAV3_9PELO|nr:unnamed protein product [Caenorhabditis auriculariae]
MPPKRRGRGRGGGANGPAAKKARGGRVSTRSTRRSKAESSSEDEQPMSDPEELGFDKNALQSVKYDYNELMNDPAYNHPELIHSIDHSELNEDYYERTGLQDPLLFHCDPKLLGMKVPDANTFTVDSVLDLVGGNRMIEVVEVSNQGSVKMSLKEFVDFYNSPPEKRAPLYNVLSLEFSNTPLHDHVMMPEIVRKIDWVQNNWPDELKQRFITFARNHKHYTPHNAYPQVQNYCLMSVAGCYTDFHIDFSGTSVWYHVLKGQKVFWLIPPTATNFLLYQEHAKNTEDRSFFGKSVETCGMVILKPGDTMLIPSGWIHAVYTPVDSLVFGGNFLHSLSCKMQIKVYQCENRLNITRKFRLPYNEELIFYVIANYVKKWTGREYARPLRIEDAKRDYIGKKWFEAGGHHKEINFADFGHQLTTEELQEAEAGAPTTEEGSLNVIAMHDANSQYAKQVGNGSSPRVSLTNEEVDKLVSSNPLIFYKNAGHDFCSNKSVQDHKLPVNAEPPIIFNEEEIRKISPFKLDELDALCTYLRKKQKVEIAEGICQPASLLKCFAEVLKHRRAQLPKEEHSPSPATTRSGRKRKSAPAPKSTNEAKKRGMLATRISKKRFVTENEEDDEKASVKPEAPVKEEHVEAAEKMERRVKNEDELTSLHVDHKTGSSQFIVDDLPENILEDEEKPTIGENYSALEEEYEEDDDDGDEYVPTAPVRMPLPPHESSGALVRKPVIPELPPELELKKLDPNMDRIKKRISRSSQELSPANNKESKHKDDEDGKKRRDEKLSAKERKKKEADRKRSDTHLDDALNAAHGNYAPRQKKKKPEKPAFAGGIPTAPIQHEPVVENPYNFDPMSEIMKLGQGQLKSAYRKTKTNIELKKDKNLYRLEPKRHPSTENPSTSAADNEEVANHSPGQNAQQQIQEHPFNVQPRIERRNSIHSTAKPPLASHSNTESPATPTGSGTRPISVDTGFPTSGSSTDHRRMSFDSRSRHDKPSPKVKEPMSAARSKQPQPSPIGGPGTSHVARNTERKKSESGSGTAQRKSYTSVTSRLEKLINTPIATSSRPAPPAATIEKRPAMLSGTPRTSSSRPSTDSSYTPTTAPPRTSSWMPSSDAHLHLNTSDAADDSPIDVVNDSPAHLQHNPTRPLPSPRNSAAAVLSPLATNSSNKGFSHDHHSARDHYASRSSISGSLDSLPPSVNGDHPKLAPSGRPFIPSRNAIDRLNSLFTRIRNRAENNYGETSSEQFGKVQRAERLPSLAAGKQDLLPRVEEFDCSRRQKEHPAVGEREERPAQGLKMTTVEKRPCAAVVVLGDVGRSPRMCNHAISLAEKHYHVQLVGYTDTTPHEHVSKNPNISIISLPPPPDFLSNFSEVIQLPLKFIWAFFTLFFTLLFRTDLFNLRLVLLQNPPALPTMITCFVVSRIKRAKFVIDWHNYMYSILKDKYQLSEAEIFDRSPIAFYNAHQTEQEDSDERKSAIKRGALKNIYKVAQNYPHKSLTPHSKAKTQFWCS